MSVRHALLALLSEGPKYGLQLRQEFEARTGEVWPLNVGQVYTTLQRLEREGLVESEDSGDEGRQKDFRITERTGLEFRTEFVNLFNHPVLDFAGGPSPFALSSGIMGQINASQGERNIQFALKFHF